jgi:hypothetical protein
MFRLLIIYSFLMGMVVFANSYETLLPRFKPDISQGQRIYSASCSQCHSSTAFTDPSWKHSLTPASMVMNLSSSSHAAGLTFEDLWHVTAYTWMKSSDSEEVAQGKTLALEGKRRMEKEALWLLLTKGHELMNLQSRDWVLSHSQEDVNTLITSLAGEPYTSLSENDKQALMSYIYASYFIWPQP